MKTKTIKFNKKESKITRIELIDENGRTYSRWNVWVKASVQDDGRTLKIFVSERVGQ